MDINVTAIERNIRLFAGPVGLCVLGSVVILAAGQWAPTSPVLSGLKAISEMASLVGAVAAASGCLWGGWRLWLLYQWENGLVDGCCYNCGGPMKHLSGRYGDYSKCLMCGSKRQGHH
jgi:hypothetical protein